MKKKRYIVCSQGWRWRQRAKESWWLAKQGRVGMKAGLWAWLDDWSAGTETNVKTGMHAIILCHRGTRISSLIKRTQESKLRMHNFKRMWSTTLARTIWQWISYSSLSATQGGKGYSMPGNEKSRHKGGVFGPVLRWRECKGDKLSKACFCPIIVSDKVAVKVCKDKKPLKLFKRNWPLFTLPLSVYMELTFLCFYIKFDLQEPWK